ncbi:hypothetical protein NKH77_31460 [Streptomyces sp. M19]
MDHPGDTRWRYRPLMSLMSSLVLAWLLPYSLLTVRRGVWSRARREGRAAGPGRRSGHLRGPRPVRPRRVPRTAAVTPPGRCSDFRPGRWPGCCCGCWPWPCSPRPSWSPGSTSRSARPSPGRPRRRRGGPDAATRRAAARLPAPPDPWCSPTTTSGRTTRVAGTARTP